jgi:hypothetical protein
MCTLKSHSRLLYLISEKPGIENDHLDKVLELGRHFFTKISISTL